MISRISVEDRNINSIRSANTQRQHLNNAPSFKGIGIWPVLLKGIQECEKNPMINVAVIDMFSAILPRTFVESLTNWFAGFEALRRESSGLIVNCLIPSYITMGVAMGLNKLIMPKGTNLAGCWADSSLIDKAAKLYKESSSADKVKDSLAQILGNIEGYDGKKKVLFKDILSGDDIEKYSQKLKDLTELKTEKPLEFSKELKKVLKEISEEISSKTHVYENIHIGSGKETVKASTIKSLLSDSVKFFRQHKISGLEMGDYAKKSKTLVKSKSLIGLAIVLPLAASMQYINRWITEKTSGIKGAPIYEDYGAEQNSSLREKSKEGLLKQKFISIGSMIGVSLLSMMKLPSMRMLEFKGLFPTMDQARIISTTTFASRMAVADDKNELAEATVRDIATFCGLYFLGDYAAKGTATILEKTTGVRLLNDTKPLKRNANAFQKFWHWMKDVTLKSSEEVVSKTAERLKAKNLKPTAAQEKIIKDEIKRAVNLRSSCQIANLGVSLILLGLIVPIFTRKNTKKRHAEDLKLASQGSTGTVEVNSSQKEGLISVENANVK